MSGLGAGKGHLATGGARGVSSLMVPLPDESRTSEVFLGAQEHVLPAVM